MPDDAGNQAEQGTKDEGQGAPRTVLPDAVADEKIEVTVAGEKKTMTRGELASELDRYRTEYAHYGGAAQVMTAAKQLEKESKENMERASSGMLIEKLSRKMQDGTATTDDINVFCKKLDIPDEQRKEMLYGEAWSESNNSDKGGNKETPRIVTEDQLDPNIREKLSTLDKLNQRQAEELFQEYTVEGLDKNENYGKIVKSLQGRDVSEEDIKDIRSELIETVRSETLLRMQRGQTYGPSMVKDAVRTVIDRINKLGIQTPNPTPPPFPGLGHGEHASLSEAFKDNQEPKRVSSDQGDAHEESFKKRFLWKLLKG